MGQHVLRAALFMDQGRELLSGITPDNVAQLLDRSGVHQVHGKAFAGLRDAALASVRSWG
ncbi:MAG: hypothetical protein NUW22_15080 [Acidobacteria bacterium]|jgi:hypothetical protein|nr:hypothetical protein [Acidobacteriota bacterium]